MGENGDEKKGSLKGGPVAVSVRTAGGGGLAGFIERQSKALISLLVLIAAVCIVFIVVSIVIDLRNKGDTEKLEALIERYNKIQAADKPADDADIAKVVEAVDAAATGTAAANVTEAGAATAAAAETQSEKPAESIESLEDFTVDLASFAKGASNYPAAKAWSMLGGIYASQEKWSEAEDAYLQSSGAGKKAPIGMISLFNAAVCAERLGNLDTAIERYTQAAATPDFPQAAHAQFAIGVLYESQNKPEEAKTAYQSVIDNFSEKDSDWSILANSRLITLGVK